MKPRQGSVGLLARLLASLISITVVGWGAAAVLSGHYYGRNTRLGGAEVSLDGAQAVAMGWCTVLFGLMPLALWCRTPRAAALWAGACALAAGAVFVKTFYLR